MTAPARIVLAYTGDVATSVALAWLVDRGDAEVVAVTLDVGQGAGLSDVRERALAVGAVRAHVIDARDEFAREFILPALQAGVQASQDPLAAALVQPLVARHLVRVAAMEGAAAVAHGCAGRGYGRMRLETAIRTLQPGLAVLAPISDRDMTPAALSAYARQHGMAMPAPDALHHRVETSLWGRTVVGGPVADPWQEPPDHVYRLTRSAAHWPEAPAAVEIRFEQGVPTAINGVLMPLPELLASLETIAGAHGVGRTDRVEPCPAGPAERVVGEAPAAVVLHLAHRELQAMVVPRDLERLIREVERTYLDLLYNGRWFTVTRDACDALIASVRQRVTGIVRVRLHKGACAVVGRVADLAPHARDAGAEVSMMSAVNAADPVSTR